ncbi:iron(III)-siderophore transporter ATP binding protein [Fictibacillus macauensis ZFHKF-1]|uniref:Iron(III)-siderophore transporter ATP binding protein n=1 Tax=Fictibacillus macauensis ZFHKF-1 TaxID=1196324 RepID=I8AL20_9BACL|nr:ABC transporter ATP-binding protein [Fictibacillus macauensis]EIT86299.1 iron(III)-siderophore transporter ATP binding protein [Fictibacillus macauensis ZFHKF-1]
MTSLQTESLTLSYGKQTIIENLHFTIPKGKITVLIGSNGCGKSTLLRSMARLLTPSHGSILLNGKDIAKRPTKDIAKELAILPQGPSAPEGLTVMELVKQGRYPYQSWYQLWSKKDEEAVQRALTATNMSELADRPVDALSGGQRQRAWIAMTLAQQTETILLDEPTTYLDMTHQIEILDLLFDLNEQEERTIVMVLHDLNLACRYAHHLVAIQGKSVFAQGAPEEIMTERLVSDVFSLSCHVMKDPIFGTPLCVPFGKGRKPNKAREVYYA